MAQSKLPEHPQLQQSLSQNQVFLEDLTSFQLKYVYVRITPIQWC